MTMKEIKAVLSGYVDSVGVKKDGAYQVKRGYFYRHGMTAERLAGVIAEKIPGAKITDARDHWAQWTAASYFVVVFTINPGEVRP